MAFAIVTGARFDHLMKVVRSTRSCHCRKYLFKLLYLFFFFLFYLSDVSEIKLGRVKQTLKDPRRPECWLKAHGFNGDRKRRIKTLKTDQPQ